VILVTGGIKSGKSTFALQKSLNRNGNRLFIATAESIDEEMETRIMKHKKERGDTHTTIEEPLNIADILKTSKQYKSVVIDCMTTWLGNLYHYKKDVNLFVKQFIKNLNGNEIIVTNEVGLSVIPFEKETRCYVEDLGKLNTKLAQISSETYLLVSGIAVKIK